MLMSFCFLVLFIEGDKGGYVCWFGFLCLTKASNVPGFPQWFNIKYDDDIAIYTAKLGEDYKAGDVIIKA